MILIGKALEDFNKWNYDNDFGYIDHEPTSLVVHFEDLDEFLRNTIIINWFDSIGIYIEIDLIHKEDNIKAFTFSLSFQDYFAYCDKEFPSRGEAIERAIINVNKIYNTIFGE